METNISVASFSPRTRLTDVQGLAGGELGVQAGRGNDAKTVRARYGLSE